jgi:hypothetical protein
MTSCSEVKVCKTAMRERERVNTLKTSRDPMILFNNIYI